MLIFKKKECGTGIIGYTLTITSIEMHRLKWITAFPCVVLSTSGSLGSYTEAPPAVPSPLSSHLHDFCQSLCTLAITGSQLHTLATCWRGQRECFPSQQLLKPDVTVAGCDWLADKGAWLSTGLKWKDVNQPISALNQQVLVNLIGNVLQTSTGKRGRCHKNVQLNAYCSFSG